MISLCLCVFVVTILMEIPYTPADPESIRLLFTRIARTYDRTNTVISLGFDAMWRKRFAKLFSNRNKIADICCGTGALFPLLGHKISAGLDFTHAMLRVASVRDPRVRLVEGDAQQMPLRDASFDAAVIVYSIRNIPDLPKAMKELYRILEPGAILGILDFGVPKGKFMESLYLGYFKYLMPFIGSCVAGDKPSYHYFVNSVLKFPKREAFLKFMTDAGFQNCHCDEYMFGAALCYTGEKAQQL